LNIKRDLFILCVGLFVVSDLCAQEHQSHESIRHAIKQFVTNESANAGDIELSISSLDPRLKLRRCSTALTTFWPPGSRMQSNTSVGVACEDDKPWKIYVPVKVSEFRDVAIVDHPLMRGDILQEGDITMERRDVSRLGQRFLEEYSRFMGYRIRQSVSAGSLLQSSMLSIPELVKRGEKVTLLANSGGIEIRMMGEALSNGGKGATIRVRNVNSKRIVEGEVVARGVVQVRL